LSAACLADRDEVLAPNPANRLHCQHSPHHHPLRIKASSASDL